MGAPVRAMTVRANTVRYFRSTCLAAVAAVIAGGLIVGCSDESQPTTQPADIHARQQQALKDPMAYGPGDPETVSGNNPNGIDKKAMKKDVDAFWNP